MGGGDRYGSATPPPMTMSGHNLRMVPDQNKNFSTSRAWLLSNKLPFLVKFDCYGQFKLNLNKIVRENREGKKLSKVHKNWRLYFLLHNFFLFQVNSRKNKSSERMLRFQNLSKPIFIKDRIILWSVNSCKIKNVAWNTQPSERVRIVNTNSRKEAQQWEKFFSCRGWTFHAEVWRIGTPVIPTQTRTVDPLCRWDTSVATQFGQSLPSFSTSIQFLSFSHFHLGTIRKLRHTFEGGVSTAVWRRWGGGGGTPKGGGKILFCP